MARVLIAGCGDVGTAAALLLAADGHDVFGLRRSPQHLPDPIVGIGGDLTDAASLDLPDVDLVAYTAAAGARTEAAYRAAYVAGLRNVLAALPRPPARLVFTSSTAVYGQDDGAWVDEDSPTEPAGFNGRVLLEAEALVREAGGTTVRLAGIYGPGRTRLIDTVRAGEAVCVDGEAGWTNRIHRDDCAGALAHLLVADRVDEVYLGVDDEPARRCDVYRWLAERLGVPGPQTVAATDAAAPRRGSDKRCRNLRLRASGYALRFPTYREGYEALLSTLS